MNLYVRLKITHKLKNKENTIYILCKFVVRLCWSDRVCDISFYQMNIDLRRTIFVSKVIKNKLKLREKKKTQRL